VIFCMFFVEKIYIDTIGLCLSEQKFCIVTKRIFDTISLCFLKTKFCIVTTSFPAEIRRSRRIDEFFEDLK